MLDKNYVLCWNEVDHDLSEEYKAARVQYIKASVQERKPEEMFDDFPELERYEYLTNED